MPRDSQMGRHSSAPTDRSSGFVVEAGKRRRSDAASKGRHDNRGMPSVGAIAPMLEALRTRAANRASWSVAELPGGSMFRTLPPYPQTRQLNNNAATDFDAANTRMVLQLGRVWHIGQQGNYSRGRVDRRSVPGLLGGSDSSMPSTPGTTPSAPTTSHSSTPTPKSWLGVITGSRQPVLCSNYDTPPNRQWDDPGLMQRYGYAVRYPAIGEPGNGDAVVTALGGQTTRTTRTLRRVRS